MPLSMSRHLIVLCVVALGAALVMGERVQLDARLLRLAPDEVTGDATVARFALAQGRAAFTSHCAVCHGIGGHGDRAHGTPDLTRGDWLYGTGRVAELERTILYGIRSGHSKTRDLAAMPAFARARPYAAVDMTPLRPGQVRDVTSWIRGLRGAMEDAAATTRGAAVYHGVGGCYDCHGEDARGDPSIGAPDLTARGGLIVAGTRENLENVVAYGLAGVCPAWIDRLPPATIRSLAAYVHALPGRSP